MEQTQAPGENAASPPVACGQCGKQAIVSIGAAPLCVECYYKFEVAKTLAVRIAAIGMNHAAAEMDQISGLPGFTPKMQVPDIPKGPIILNNIKVDNSVVGSINTGSVQTIDVNISYLETSGNDEASNALKVLAEAIANTPDLATADKNNLLDQVAYLSEQAAASAQNRKPGMIRAAFLAITQSAGAVAAVATAWTAAAPLLKALFGLP